MRRCDTRRLVTTVSSRVSHKGGDENGKNQKLHVCCCSHAPPPSPRVGVRVRVQVGVQVGVRVGVWVRVRVQVRVGVAVRVRVGGLGGPWSPAVGLSFIRLTEGSFDFLGVERSHTFTRVNKHTREVLTRVEEL